MTSSPGTDDTTQLLGRFIDSFQRGIDAEMRAMQDRLGPFEIPLGTGRRGGDPDTDEGGLYAFNLSATDERLLPQLECTLRSDGTDLLVTVVSVDPREVLLAVPREIRLERSYSLIVYPWFLYEKLKEALEKLPDSDDHIPESALRLFGKLPTSSTPRPIEADHAELNESQLHAVRLSSESDLAFVWGPPGTGKTHTLGHIVSELVHQGERLLITSTTNAAVDQALAKLMEIDETRRLIDAGLVIRIGQRSAEENPADLREAVRRQNERLGQQLARVRERAAVLDEERRRAGQLLAAYKRAGAPLQFDMFRETRKHTADLAELTLLFGPERAATIASLPEPEQEATLARHAGRLERAARLAVARGTELAKLLRSREGSAIERARVIMATMTNLYLSPLLKEELFDTVIVEEAGMAVLPSLFYAASLSKRRVIVVGDPQQLPPIVQSNEEFARRAMGRNIFEVTVPRPFESEIVALLDTQYRMHPAIGTIVSELYYGGRLVNGADTGERSSIAGRRPYPGDPLVVVDTGAGTAEAGFGGGRSRRNEKSAELAVELAVEGVRDGLESVAIITPYVDQARLIRELLGRYRLEASRIECRTVHRFQGSERDMVILDTVDAPPLNPGTLLASERSGARNLINVGISRARGKLIVVADVEYFLKRAPRSPISELLARAAAEGRRVEG